MNTMCKSADCGRKEDKPTCVILFRKTIHSVTNIVGRVVEYPFFRVKEMKTSLISGSNPSSIQVTLGAVHHVAGVAAVVVGPGVALPYQDGPAGMIPAV